MKRNSSSVKLQKRSNKKKGSFWGFLCPCLRSKNSQSEKDHSGRESDRRQEFYEQKTQNEQEVHEETESNLPVHFGTSEFEPKKRQQVRLERQDDKVMKIKQVKSEDQKLVKFNIKRNNNMGGYLMEAKNGNKKLEGKENSNPTSTVQRQEKQTGNVNNRDSKSKQKPISYKAPLSRGIRQRMNNNYNLVDRQQLISLEKRLQQMQGLGDYEFLLNWQQAYENHYPINKLDMNKLIVLGDRKNKMLAKVSTVRLVPSAAAMERYKDYLRNKKLSQKYNKPQIGFNSQLDRYWDKRYFLFERFDQGIQLDQQSWYSVTPEAVADYISSKINVKDTVLDAFCGAGGDAIKLATTCNKVIANDIDSKKIACLVNNAKIYDITNLTVSCQDYFSLDCKVDAVYLAPPWGGPDYYKLESFHPQSFQPKLSVIIQKAFKLSHNIFFLLPANTDIQALISIISQKLKSVTDFVPQSCSLKLEKIYFNERLKFVAGFYGTSEVQNEIKLSDELKYVYEMLRQSDEGIFKHKRLIRKIREEYGMVKLLNWVFQCQNYMGKQELSTLNKNWPTQNIDQVELIQRFERMLLDKKLIDPKTLQKIKAEQQIEYEYELKNRQNRSKNQKNKKIQKQKEKQQRHVSENFNVQGKRMMNSPEEGNDQHLTQWTKHENRLKQLEKLDIKQLNGTVRSQIQSQNIIQQSQDIPIRDSLRTVSIASQFHEDQLHNLTYERITTQSDVSIKDSILGLQRYDTLDISVEESYRLSKEQGMNGLIMDEKESKTHRQQERTRGWSSPAVLSPRDNFKMKKVKVGPRWQKGIVEQVNEETQKDF